MAKITRKAAKIFGSTASTNQIAKFGSLAAASPIRYSGATADPDNIQALGNWLTGWFAGVEGANSPAIEDLNAFCFVMAYQIAYQMQEGVAEWNSATTYYIGSIAQDGSGNLFISKTNSNLNNALGNNSNWSYLGDAVGQQMTSVGANPIANARTRAVTLDGTDPGAGGVCISPSSGNSYSNSTGTYTDVTNMSCTLTTTGRPVVIMLTADTGGVQAGGPGEVGSGGALWRYVRDASTTIAVTSFSGGSNPAQGLFNVVDPAVAGSHTWKLQAQRGASTSVAIGFCQLVVYEL